jgi:hypothetical protein
VGRKLTVVGGGALGATLAERLRERDYAEVVVDDVDELSGSHVVVLAGASDEVLERIRDHAPSAVLVVADGSIEAACRTTLFPRSRVIGVESDPEAVLEVVDALLLSRERVLTCTVRCEGERGIDGAFAAVPVRVWAGGVKEILEDGQA